MNKLLGRILTETQGGYYEYIGRAIAKAKKEGDFAFAKILKKYKKTNLSDTEFAKLYEVGTAKDVGFKIYKLI